MSASKKVLASVALLDEVRVVAGAVRRDGGGDGAERAAIAGSRRRLGHDSQAEHADLAGQRGARSGARRVAAEGAAHVAQLQHRQRRARPGDSASSSMAAVGSSSTRACVNR